MAAPSLKILFVDDEKDLVWLISELLSRAGYEVDTAGSADEGLRLLRANEYDLVITDRHMPPGEDGITMLQKAGDRIANIPVWVMTANPDIGPAPYQVLTKPVDVDFFLRLVNDALEPARQRAVDRAVVPAAASGEPTKIDFILYISAASPASLKATRNMMRLIDQYPPGVIGFRLRDLAKEPIRDVDEDRVTFTPTLVKRGPAGRAWVIGDLDNIKYVADLIAAAGVEKKS